MSDPSAATAAPARPTLLSALLPDRITGYTRVLAWLLLISNIVIVGTGGLRLHVWGTGDRTRASSPQSTRPGRRRAVRYQS